MTMKMAFQGELGAFSDLCCSTFAPEFETQPLPTFEAVFHAVTSGTCQAAMVPVENSLAGRVDDVYRLLPDRGVAVVAEHFLPVKMQLMTAPGVDPAGLKTVRSHPMALSQCRRMIARRGLLPEAAGDTAGAARELRDEPTPDVAVIAPVSAAERYGLTIIEPDCQDADRNVTRFLHIVPDGAPFPEREEGIMLTSFIFRVRNIPSALYKALGGFATNGVNMTKLESYMVGGAFTATQFYADIEGHPDDPHVARALEELDYFTNRLDILGVYPTDVERDAPRID